MVNFTRRQVVSAAPLLLGGTSLLAGCGGADPDGYEAIAAQIRRPGSLVGIEGTALSRELVRLATLAPSSHNTQCWKFGLEDHAIVIHADRSRQCPAVDPDNHHLFVSLGCATESLVHGSLAYGLNGEAAFDAAGEVIRVELRPTKAAISPWFNAIATRQCTRGDYDSRPLSSQDLGALERAGTSENVRMLLITEPTAVKRVLDYVVQANTAQMADAAFVRELKTWIRFNGAQAARSRDGLYGATTGNPTIPTWLGELAFGSFFKAKGENEKYVRQIRSSAGIAVFVGRKNDKAGWVEVGRCYERFALQATTLGIRNAFLNQPVEVQSVRPKFAAALGLSGQRPDLVVRFGRGPAMPRSLRRPVDAVLI